jgi:hypothetical protein
VERDGIMVVGSTEHKLDAEGAQSFIQTRQSPVPGGGPRRQLAIYSHSPPKPRTLLEETKSFSKSQASGNLVYLLQVVAIVE